MIKVNPNMCKGCELCVLNCPQKIIELSAEVNEKGYRTARQIDENKCTSCALCAIVCPDAAITVYN